MYLDELRLERPGSSERVLRIQSRRLARLDLLAGHEDRHGVLRHQRRGEPYPATLLAEKIASAYIAADRDLEARERDADAPNARQALDQLREVGRAIAQAREADDG
jgi:hypothetical protein